MDRRTALVVVLAGLSILAIALAAATLDAVDTESTGTEGGGSRDVPLEPAEGDGPIDPIEAPGTLVRIAVLAIAIIGLVSVAYLLYRGPPRRRWLAAALIGAIVVVALFLWILEPWSGGRELPEFGGAGPEQGVGGEGEGGLPGQSGDSGSGVPDSLVWIGLGLLALVAAVGLVALSRSDAGLAGLVGSGPAPAHSDEEAEAEAVGRAAGRAADRIAAADDTDEALDNEVYRAWEEMTDSLSVERPETTTPGQFETAAVEAGIPESDVRELRRLFEDVRYGGRRPTEKRERRALDCFRRIESKFGPEEP